MGQISLSIPQTGQLNSTEDPKIASDFTTLQTVINGSLDSTNIQDTFCRSASVNSVSFTVKGTSNIAANDTTSSSSYVLLSNADQVTNINLNTNGLLEIWYTATWNSSSNAFQAYAAIFIGSNQLKLATTTGNPGVQECTIQSGLTGPLTPYGGGLGSPSTGSGTNAPVTTGQIIGAPIQVPAGGGGGSFTNAGGPVYVFANAGTYTVSVKFKADSGATASVSNRKLWVRALSFA